MGALAKIQYTCDDEPNMYALRTYFLHKPRQKIDNYHLFTETEGNSVFCGPETAVVSRGEAEGNNDGRGATKHTAFPRSQ